MKSFLIALQFLTIIPVQIKSNIEEKDFGKSLRYFPVIGLVIGFIQVFVMLSLNFLPDYITGVLVVITSSIITGALHIDGLSDTLDALYVAGDREKALMVMRDSSVGAIGAASVVLALLLKVSLITAAIKTGMWQAPILMAVFSRWCQVLTCFTGKYAREEGKAKNFIKYADKLEMIIATIIALFFFTVLYGKIGFLSFFLAFIPLYLWITWIKKKFNGITGDIIGATSEIAELLIIFPVFMMV